jgi:hypothetical protein
MRIDRERFDQQGAKRSSQRAATAVFEHMDRLTQRRVVLVQRDGRAQQSIMSL